MKRIYFILFIALGLLLTGCDMDTGGKRYTVIGAGDDGPATVYEHMRLGSCGSTFNKFTKDGRDYLFYGTHTYIEED